MKDWQIITGIFSKRGKPHRDRAQKFHAIRRFATRFKHRITEEEYDQLVKQIQNNKLEFVERQTNRTTVWKVIIHNKEVIAIYDKKTKAIRTFMPVGMYMKEQVEEKQSETI